MRFFKQFTLPFVLALALFSPAIFGQQGYRQNAIYLTEDFDWSNIKAALLSGYNRFYVGFYTSKNGGTCQGACASWLNLSNHQRQEIGYSFNAFNAYLYLTVGGPDEFWPNCMQTNCATTFGQNAGHFAEKYLFDGIEFSLNLATYWQQHPVPSPYAVNGSYIQMAQDLVSSARKTSGNSRNFIAVASSAPYFSPAFMGNDLSKTLSYLALEKNQYEAWAVSDCNLLMFNQGSNYMSYNDIFIMDSYADGSYGAFGNGSAVEQVVNLGIATDNVAVIKPISSDMQTTLTGYITPSQLGSWGCQAYDAFGWLGGFIGWAWNADSSSMTESVQTFGANILQAKCSVS